MEVLLRILLTIPGSFACAPELPEQMQQEQMQQPLVAMPQRVATALQVVNAAGEHVVGAELLCFAEPWPTDFEGHSDLVISPTGVGGRAVVKLLPGRKYSVAASVGFEKGFVATCVEAESLVAGAARTLQLGAIQPLDLRSLAGLDQWQELGPLAVEVSPLEAGSFFVPIQQHATLLAKRMRVVDQDRATIWESAAASALTNGMPAPRAIRLRVNMVRGGPAGGVEIWQRIPADVREARGVLLPPRRDGWRLLGQSDAQGQATVLVAVRASGDRVREPLLLQARKPGCVPAIAGFLDAHTAFHDYVALAAAADHVLEFTMRYQTPVKVVPAASYRMTIWGRGHGGQVSPAEGPLTLLTSSAGESSLPVQPSRDCTRIVQVEQVGQAQQDPIWSLLELGVGPCQVQFAGNVVDVAVRDVLGNPLREGNAYLTAISLDQALWLSTSMPLRLDAAGRCRLRLASNAHWVIWARHGDRVAWQVVSDAALGNQVVALELRPAPRATVRVLVSTGEPLLDGEEVMWSGSGKSTERTTPEAAFLPHLQAELEHGQVFRVGLDQHGEFSMPMLPGIQRTISVGHRSLGQSERVELVAGEVVELTLR